MISSPHFGGGLLLRLLQGIVKIYDRSVSDDKWQK